MKRFCDKNLKKCDQFANVNQNKLRIHRHSSSSIILVKKDFVKDLPVYQVDYVHEVLVICVFASLMRSSTTFLTNIKCAKLKTSQESTLALQDPDCRLNQTKRVSFRYKPYFKTWNQSSNYHSFTKDRISVEIIIKM